MNKFRILTNDTKSTEWENTSRSKCGNCSVFFSVVLLVFTLITTIDKKSLNCSFQMLPCSFCELVRCGFLRSKLTHKLRKNINNRGFLFYCLLLKCVQYKLGVCVLCTFHLIKTVFCIAISRETLLRDRLVRINGAKY